MNKAVQALPKSPIKKAAVVKKLSDTFTPQNRTQANCDIPELDKAIQQFYESDTISRQLPGRKDFVTLNKDTDRLGFRRKCDGNIPEI